MKIAVLGGGGFRVPRVYGALLARSDRLTFDEVTLYDVDERRLRRIAPVLEGLERERGQRLPIRPTLDLDAALDGADFVFCAIRVGQLEGRVIDESVPLQEGVVGQETTGPGGLSFALRTVPVMMDLARAVARRAPEAWFINFTNPAGLVTEALQEVLGGRAIGICDSAMGLCRRVAGALGRSPDELSFDYFGLNHLGWLRAAYDGDRDLLPGLLADDQRLATFEEGELFGGEWLRSLGMIPNEYLYFYYFASDTVAALRSGLESRAAFLLRQQRTFYAAEAASPEDALRAWRATRREREDSYFAEARAAAGLGAAAHEGEDLGGYEGQAMAVVEAIANDQGRMLILDTTNRNALPFLDASAVVEVPCRVDRAGAVPVAVGQVPGHARALIDSVKEVERMTIRASLERSRQLAVKAIALHPLVPSVNVARRIFDAYAARQPELRDFRP
ncbi:MAG: 6-phospho-beta-glucosidase [Chloroflexota bacterium]|nr:6-phospho-beta-glucosidase [Chloroflexota bacterium]